MAKTILQNLILFFIFFFSGCYNPPKFVCSCYFECQDIYANSTLSFSQTVGGETKKETIANCDESVKKMCSSSNYQIKNVSCHPQSWEEWNKNLEKCEKERMGLFNNTA
ncbi:MAG: hypothetical protein N3D10_01730 [Candidatus Micrarchaeota archaeon]|nr:hypothetical protein [Candidatus Micrarchaeota archaeon]